MLVETKNETTYPRVLWNLLAIACVLATAAGLYMLYDGQLEFREMGGGGADDPIIMAGGSMHLFGSGKFVKQSGTDLKLEHSDKNRYIQSIDVLGDPGTGVALSNVQIGSGRDVTIAMRYCDDVRTCTTLDTVTYSYTAGNKAMELTNTDGAYAIGPEVHKKTVAEHQPQSRHLKDITINGTTYACPNNGKCFLMIHFFK